jgi:hypothetical protein
VVGLWLAEICEADLRISLNWVIGPKRCQSCQIHQNCVFSVVIIGLYDPKTGSKLELLGPKWGYNWVVIP